MVPKKPLGFEVTASLTDGQPTTGPESTIWENVWNQPLDSRPDLALNVGPLVAARTLGRKDRMAKVIVLYKKPKSTEAFDKHYASTHIPLAKKIPGLKKYDISNGPVATPSGASDVHLIATLSFESLDALKAGMGSAEGKAAAGDLANFADGGADLYIFDTKDA
jgi:uncharacterized protein (TIGR02118 family)